MERNNGDNSDWVMHRRMEGLVNKHMADIAFETLQQRLSAVSDEMNSLAEHVSRRSDEIPKDEIPRRGDVNFDVEPLTATYSTESVGEKLLPSTPSAGKIMHLGAAYIRICIITCQQLRICNGTGKHVNVACVVSQSHLTFKSYNWL